MEISEETLFFGLGKEELHIVPIVAGAKDQGWGKIILGAVLFGFGAVVGFGNTLFSVAGANITGGMIARVGIGFVLGGVGQLLSPTPQTGSRGADERASFLFNGVQNLLEQGNPVPLVYGEFIVGSVTVSAGLLPEQIDLR
jgi:predicted phage tail protein